MFYKKFYHIFFVIARKNTGFGIKIPNSRTIFIKAYRLRKYRNAYAEGPAGKNKRTSPPFPLTGSIKRAIIPSIYKNGRQIE
jgi:hypothetical protein